jgi:hypothetical protein
MPAKRTNKKQKPVVPTQPGSKTGGGAARGKPKAATPAASGTEPEDSEVHLRRSTRRSVGTPKKAAADEKARLDAQKAREVADRKIAIEQARRDAKGAQEEADRKLAALVALDQAPQGDGGESEADDEEEEGARGGNSPGGRSGGSRVRYGDASAAYDTDASEVGLGGDLLGFFSAIGPMGRPPPANPGRSSALPTGRRPVPAKSASRKPRKAPGVTEPEPRERIAPATWANISSMYGSASNWVRFTPFNNARNQHECRRLADALDHLVRDGVPLASTGMEILVRALTGVQYADHRKDQRALEEIEWTPPGTILPHAFIQQVQKDGARRLKLEAHSSPGAKASSGAGALE